MAKELRTCHMSSILTHCPGEFLDLGQRETPDELFCSFSMKILFIFLKMFQRIIDKRQKLSAGKERYLAMQTAEETGKPRQSPLSR
ncbi:MAG: hypothetical protein OEL83_03040 [Desulforhopalus sp.]|nr:hypothetical protein [Desulforhopalus sp.]